MYSSCFLQFIKKERSEGIRKIGPLMPKLSKKIKVVHFVDHCQIADVDYTLHCVFEHVYLAFSPQSWSYSSLHNIII